MEEFYLLILGLSLIDNIQLPGISNTCSLKMTG